MKMTRKHQLLLLAALVTGATQATAATVTSTADVSNTLTFASDLDITASFDNQNIVIPAGTAGASTGVITISTKNPAGVTVQTQIGDGSTSTNGKRCMVPAGTFDATDSQTKNTLRFFFHVPDSSCDASGEWTTFNARVTPQKPLQIPSGAAAGFVRKPGTFTINVNARGYTD